MPARRGSAIYLDYNATTPVDPRVRRSMLPYLDQGFGNPSSGHVYGRQAAVAVERARGQVASLLGARPDQIVFTGGGTEANNLAILGTCLAGKKRHIVTQETEHPAVLNTIRYLVDRLGFRATVLPVDGYGRLNPASVEAAVEPDTAIVSIMHANNETGSILPIREIASICRTRGIFFHTDAAQSVGKVATLVDDLGVDLLTVAGHKLYGPKGVGALYVRASDGIDPILHGAGQERGLRAGTENVAGIVGLGYACVIAAATLDAEEVRLRGLRDRLHKALAASTALVLNGHPFERLPNTLNVRFVGQDGESLLGRTPGVAASTGSACHSGQTDPSPVLLAMEIPAEEAVGAVRLTLGRFTTRPEVDRAAELLLAALQD